MTQTKRPTPEAPRRSIGLVAASSLVVASMVGAGVFTTSGILLRELGSPLAVIGVWAVGGVLATCCALSYAELCTALPANGGEYRLLSRIFHPGVGFVAGWVSLLVGFSAPIAAVSQAFGLYLARVFPWIAPLPAGNGAIAFFALLHGARVSLGSKVNAAITLVEVVLIFAFSMIGHCFGRPERLLESDGASFAHAVRSPAFAVGLVYVSFAYSGWNAAAYVAGEVTRPERNLQRALLLGTSVVGMLYIAVNTAFMAAAPRSALAGVVEVGQVAAERLFGPLAGRALSGTIALCLFASIGAQLVTGARVCEAMGGDYPALRVLSFRPANTGPVVGIVVQSVAAAAMASTASFDALLTYVGLTLSICALVTIAGVFVLRRREPDLARPYRATGYPLTPMLAMGLMLWMILETLSERPMASVAGLATLALGAGLYLAVRPTRRS